MRFMNGGFIVCRNFASRPQYISKAMIGNKMLQTNLNGYMMLFLLALVYYEY